MTQQALEQEKKDSERDLNLIAIHRREITAIFQQWSVLLDLISDAVVVTHDGTIREVNAAFKELMGCRENEDLVGLEILSLIADKDKERVAAIIRKKQEMDYDTTLIKLNGSLIDVHIKARRIYGEQGRVSRLKVIRARA